jgi:hypothetical protein
VPLLLLPRQNSVKKLTQILSKTPQPPQQQRRQQQASDATSSSKQAMQTAAAAWAEGQQGQQGHANKLHLFAPQTPSALHGTACTVVTCVLFECALNVCMQA